MLIELYHSNPKTRKWYMRIFYYVLDSAVVNAWLIYRLHWSQSNDKPMPLLKFKTSIACSLGYSNIPQKHPGIPLSLETEGTPPRKIPAQPTPPPYRRIFLDSEKIKNAAEVVRGRQRSCVASALELHCALFPRGTVFSPTTRGELFFTFVIATSFVCYKNTWHYLKKNDPLRTDVLLKTWRISNPEPIDFIIQYSLFNSFFFHLKTSFKYFFSYRFHNSILKGIWRKFPTLFYPSFIMLKFKLPSPQDFKNIYSSTREFRQETIFRWTFTL